VPIVDAHPRSGDARELAPAQAQRWQNALQACLKRSGKTPEQAAQDAKSADWKVAIATGLRLSTTASNPWLAEVLNMGAPGALSRLRRRMQIGQTSGNDALVEEGKQIEK